MHSKLINIDPEILSGTPVFAGTRVPISNLYDYLETGETIDDFLEDFESVNKEQVVGILEISQRLLQTPTNILNESFAWNVLLKN